MCTLGGDQNKLCHYQPQVHTEVVRTKNEGCRIKIVGVQKPNQGVQKQNLGVRSKKPWHAAQNMGGGSKITAKAQRGAETESMGCGKRASGVEQKKNMGWRKNTPQVSRVLETSSQDKKTKCVKGVMGIKPCECVKPTPGDPHSPVDASFNFRVYE